MNVAILSDTHVPSRATRIPDQVRERIESADHVIHAGDFDSKSALADVRDLAQSLTAVRGNMDPRIGLPAVATTELDGVQFVVTHGTGSKRGYEDRVANAVRQHGDGAVGDADSPSDVIDRTVGVAGHTHEVMDERHGGVHLLNPGSATGAAPAARTTMMTATVDDGKLDVEILEL